MKNKIKKSLANWRGIWITAALFFPFFVSGQNTTLSLDQAIEKARANNRSLRTNLLENQKSQRRTAISRGMLMPNIGLTGQYQHYFQRPVFFGLDGSANSEKIGYARFGGEDVATAQLSLVQPIYHSGARHEIKKSRLLETQSQLSMQQREVDIVAEVKQNYVRQLVLAERLKLLQESISRNKKALADSRYLLAQGKALRVDTLRAHTLVKNLEPDILKLNYALEISSQQLHNLLGDTSLTAYVLSDSLTLQPSDPIPDEQNAYRLSVAQRPDMRILALRKEITGEEIEIQRSLKKPVVSFVSQYLLQTQTNQFRFGNAAYPPVFFAGVTVAVPIFSGNQNTNRIALSKIEREVAELTHFDAQQELKTEIKTVIAQLRETAGRIDTQREVAANAETSYAIIKYRYEKGVASRLELMDAELALTTAKANYLESVFDYLSAKIELDRASGVVSAAL